MEQDITFEEAYAAYGRALDSIDPLDGPAVAAPTPTVTRELAVELLAQEQLTRQQFGDSLSKILSAFTQTVAEDGGPLPEEHIKQFVGALEAAETLLKELRGVRRIVVFGGVEALRVAAVDVPAADTAPENDQMTVMTSGGQVSFSQKYAAQLAQPMPVEQWRTGDIVLGLPDGPRVVREIPPIEPVGLANVHWEGGVSVSEFMRDFEAQVFRP